MKLNFDCRREAFEGSEGIYKNSRLIISKEFEEFTVIKDRYNVIHNMEDLINILKESGIKTDVPRFVYMKGEDNCLI